MEGPPDRACDRGLLSIDDDPTVLLVWGTSTRRDEFFSRAIAAYAGQQIRSPQKFLPSKESLAYHRERVFLG